MRHQAHRFGGSRAQRDLVDLTLVEAALRSPLAQRLVSRARALHRGSTGPLAS